MEECESDLHGARGLHEAIRNQERSVRLLLAARQSAPAA